MNKLTKTLTICIAAIALTSCDFLNNIVGGYKNYEDYFTDELKFEKSTDINDFNNKLDERGYFWRKYDSDDYASYYTGKNLLVAFKKSNANRIAYVSFTSGKNVYFEYDENGFYLYNNRSIYLDSNGQYWKNGMNKRGIDSDVTAEERESLKIHKYDDGYLLVVDSIHMFFLPNDYASIFVNESNSKTFQGFETTKTISDSDLLNNTLTALGKDVRLELPAPEGKPCEIWHGMDYYKENKSHYSAYIADVDPSDYAKTLKKNGFTVIRSYEDDFYTFYGTRGGYWYCYDEKAELEVLLKSQDYLYTSPLGKTYGPTRNTYISFYKMHSGYSNNGNAQTKNEDWTDEQKQTMNDWYDGKLKVIVPFVKLGSNYHVSSITSFAHEGLMDGTLKHGFKCYNITDSNIHYYLEGYDQTLEANGFHKYVPNYDLSDSEQRSQFLHTEESKYANCYINQEKNCAIKYYYDVNNGNTIRVFKLDEMQSWLQDEK